MWIDINEAVILLNTSRRTLDRQVAAKLEKMIDQARSWHRARQGLHAQPCYRRLGGSHQTASSISREGTLVIRLGASR